MILIREEDFREAEARKKKLLKLYIVIACVYAVSALLLLFLSPDRYTICMIADILLTIAFAFYSIFFFTVSYDLAVKRYRLLDKVLSALSEREYGIFMREDAAMTYEGLEMRTLCFVIQGSERIVHLLQGDVSLAQGTKCALEIHAGVLVSIGEKDEEAFS